MNFMILFVSSKRNDYEICICSTPRHTYKPKDICLIPSRLQQADQYIYLYHEKINKCLSVYIVTDTRIYDADPDGHQQRKYYRQPDRRYENGYKYKHFENTVCNIKIKQASYVLKSVGYCFTTRRKFSFSYSNSSNGGWMAAISFA